MFCNSECKVRVANYFWFSHLALSWMSLDLTDDKSTLVQVMAWCCQTRSHYLSQYWPSCHMGSLGHNGLKLINLSHISKIPIEYSLGPLLLTWFNFQYSLESLLLTWFNFNPIINKYFHPLLCVGWNCSFNLKLQRCSYCSLRMDK